jgi:hypothetical protein
MYLSFIDSGEAIDSWKTVCKIYVFLDDSFFPKTPGLLSQCCSFIFFLRLTREDNSYGGGLCGPFRVALG